LEPILPFHRAVSEPDVGPKDPMPVAARLPVGEPAMSDAMTMDGLSDDAPITARSP
jgi:hypothetical protein